MNAPPQSRPAPVLGLLRTCLLAGLMLGLFLSYAGKPALRLTYQYRQIGAAKHITSATYITFGGRLPVMSGQYAEGCPFIILVPLDKPLLQRAREFLQPATTP